MTHYDEIKTASVQTYELGCMPTIYVINITISYISPTFVGLGIDTLIYWDLFVIILNGKYPEISVTDLRDIWNKTKLRNPVTSYLVSFFRCKYPDNCGISELPLGL